MKLFRLMNHRKHYKTNTTDLNVTECVSFQNSVYFLFSNDYHNVHENMHIFLTRPCIQAFIGWDNVFVLFHDANLAHTTFIQENMNCEWESTLLLHPLIILLFLVCPSPVMSTIINCFYLVDLQRMLFYCHIVLKMKNI